MPRYFEFEVSLCEVEPRIWRQFLLPSGRTTFLELHEAILEACGRWNYHMFVFRQPGSRDALLAGIPDDLDLEMYGKEVPDAGLVVLDSYFKGPGRWACDYEYDFGDGWLHEVKLLQEVELPDKFKRRLIAGARAFPHEDSGGLGGYERYAEFLLTGIDPWEENPDELRTWLDGWHPDHFDLEDTKRRFDRPRRSVGAGRSRSTSKEWR
jgi:hypothetical protein